MTIKFGSARQDENGAYSGGTAGDQTGKEVCTQTMYTHAKGWYILRAKKASTAKKLASAMKTACDNEHIGYDQSQRTGIYSHGTDSAVDTECDCSSLVCQCVREATGTTVGNFTTSTEVGVLAATDLFYDKIAYVSQAETPLYNGDVLVTKTKGHTGIIVSGSTRPSSLGSDGTASSATTSGTAATPTYKVGTVYTTQVDCLNVRSGAGTSYARKTKAQLTADAQKHCNSKGQLNKGTSVTCKATKTLSSGAVWMNIPSGWVCAWTGSKYYVK